MNRFSFFAFLIVIIFLIALYVQNHSESSEIYTRYEEEPFDNFACFNDLQSFESGVCRPFLLTPKQADYLELIAPDRFSCNSPMGKYSENVSFANGVLEIGGKLKNCFYSEIVRVGRNGSDDRVAHKKDRLKISPGSRQKIRLEQFVLFCLDEENENYIFNKTFFNFYAEQNQKTPEKKIEENAENSLIILSISGICHNQAMRHLKRTLNISSHMDFHSFSMFNQQTENAIENVWQHFNLTFLQTDNIMNFPGIRPTFYPDLYNLYNIQHLGRAKNCISDGRVTVEDDVTLWKNFSEIFRREPHFSLLHVTGLKGADGKLVNLDDILEVSIKELLDFEHIRENTTIVVMSDGVRNSSVFGTESGKIEAMYGFFMIRLSDKIRNNYQEKVDVLKRNVDRLVTTSNIASTLKTAVFPQNRFSGSLLDSEIDVSRKCEGPSCICSTVSNVKPSTLISSLEKLVKAEVSTQKCLSRVEIETFSEIREFRDFYFTTFNITLTTGTVKLSDAGNLKEKEFKFEGKSRFWYSQENENVERIELVGQLRNIDKSGFKVDDMCAKVYYHQIHMNFQKQK